MSNFFISKSKNVLKDYLKAQKLLYFLQCLNLTLLLWSKGCLHSYSWNWLYNFKKTTLNKLNLTCFFTFWSEIIIFDHNAKKHNAVINFDLKAKMNLTFFKNHLNGAILALWLIPNFATLKFTGPSDCLQYYTADSGVGVIKR